jgi:hypothetical protein
MGPLTAIWPRIHSILQTGRQTAHAGSPAGRNPAQEQLAGLRDGLARLRSMPSAHDIAREVAMNRIAVIKQRLEALKAMLRFASPEQAKALAVELRNLARELASVARAIGSSAPAASAAPAAGPADATGSPLQAEAESGEPTGDGNPAADPASSGDPVPSSILASPGDHPPAASPSVASPAPAGDDGSLRAALKEAQKLLKEVAHMLRARLPRHDKDSRHLLQEIQHSIDQIDRSLDPAGLPDAGTGNPTTGIAEVAATGMANGSIIDVKA